MLLNFYILMKKNLLVKESFRIMKPQIPMAENISRKTEKDMLLLLEISPLVKNKITFEDIDL